MKINKIYALSTSVVNAQVNVNNNFVIIHFNPNDFNTNGSWELDSSDTSRILCKRSGTYTINCNMKYNLNTPSNFDFWMQYNNDKNRVDSPDGSNIIFTYNFNANTYINFFVCQYISSCNIGANGTCTLSIDL